MINFLDIHMATITHTEFRKYGKPGPMSQLVEI